MTISIYDISVPAFRRTLKALLALLSKAEAHCAEAVLEARLAPDMQPFAFHIVAAIDNSVGAVERLRGRTWRRPPTPVSFSGLKAAVTEALSRLEEVPPADLLDAEAREILLPNPRGARRFDGLDYLRVLALPNFYFHVSIAYALLRADGVEIGKRDYLGELPPRLPVAEPAGD